MTRTSTRSNSNEISYADVGWLAAAVVLVLVIYLTASRLTFAIGFPLDDSWIHQTYARNLATRGEWAFRPGVVSAGSTSPLWSILLALGFLLRLSPYIWTYLLGALTLLGLAVTCEWAARKLVDEYRPRFPWLGLFMVFEWHLAWAAMSGMETLLHGLILTLVLVLLMTNSRRYLPLGLLTGLAAWVRPDGLTLLGPVIFALLLMEGDVRSRGAALTRYLIGFGSLFMPYLLFNLAIGGTPMPNTFYAKQAEYASWQQLSIITRLGQMSLQLLVGPALSLLPGLVLWGKTSIEQRRWGSLAAFVWCAGYLGLYVLRLPMYQHGRYIMPAMPAFFLFGLLGLAGFIAQDRKSPGTVWVMQTVWRAAVIMLLAGFVFLGAVSYARDVAFIESEMVATAKWVAANAPADQLIAAHDIGALGFYDSHELIDLAGLISPEVIPFIRDEARLAEFLDQRSADYLIVFPGFYPQLTSQREIVFVTTLDFGEENMAVYRWKRP